MSIAGTDIKTEEKYISLFNENQGRLNIMVSDKVAGERENAIRIFENKGIPNRKVESYKYTNLNPQFEKDYSYDFNHEVFNQNLTDVFNCNVEDLEAITIYLIQWLVL